MAKWEFAIAVKDEKDLASGHKRKKEGDVIGVAPYPHNWGKKEVDAYLIVVVDNLTKEEAHDLCSPYYDIDPATVDMEDLEAIQPTIIGKRKYKLPLNIIKDGWHADLNLTDVRDKTKVYQPLKENNVVLDANEQVSIFFDKEKDSFKYATPKSIG